MEPFATPLENPEKERLERLAERALAFAGALDPSSSSNLHIYRALDSERIMDQATRQRLIPEIKKILTWLNRPDSEREKVTEHATAMEAPLLRENGEGAAM